MENQDPQSGKFNKDDGKPPIESKSVPTPPTVQEASRPKVAMTDAQINALLRMTNTSASASPKKKLPIGFIFSIILLVVLLYMAGPLISRVSRNRNTRPQSSDTQNTSASKATSNEINNDAKQCQNVANVLSEC